MKKTQSTAKGVDEFLTLEEYKEIVSKLEEKIKTKEIKIATLESELKLQQEEELKHRQEDLNNLYAWMGETIRMRRLSETIGEDLEEYKKRTEKAERGLRNLKKWLEISGEEGGADGRVSD